MLEKQLAAAKPSQWDEYFSEEDYQPDNHLAKLIHQLVTHLSTDAGKQHIAALQPPDAGSYTLPFSYQVLKDASAVEDLRIALEHQPVVALKCLSVAFAEVRDNNNLNKRFLQDHAIGRLWLPQKMAHSQAARRPLTGPTAAATRRLPY